MTRLLRTSTLPFVFAVGLALPALAVEITLANPAPKALYGTYAPGGDCSKQPQVVLDATGLYSVVAGAKAKVEPVDICTSCVAGFEYEGPEHWALTVAKGGDEHPVNFRFNADEKMGALLVESYDGGPGVTPTLKTLIATKSYALCKAR